MGARLFTPRRAVAGADEPEAPAKVASHAEPLRKGREAAALLLFAIAVFLCLALASLRTDPMDPALEGADWMGPVGAFVAGILVRAFGLVAWFAPIELALLSAPLFTKRANRANALRLAGDLVVAIILSSLVQVVAPELLAFGRAPAAGNVGLLFGELMRAMFSTLGSFLVGSTAVGLILIGRSSFSFIELCQKAMTFGRWLMVRFRAAGDRLGVAWRQAQEIRQQKRAEAALAKLPHISDKPSDEAIIAHLTDDDSDWSPLESTGEPPLALSEQLKQTFQLRAKLDSEPGQTQSPPQAEEVSKAPQAKTPTPTLADAVLGSDDAEDVSPRKRKKQKQIEVEAPEVEPEQPDETLLEAAEEPEAVDLTPKKSKGKKAKDVELGPTIVDTKPQQQTEKARRIAKKKAGTYELPSTELLEAPPPTIQEVDKASVLELSDRLEKTLADYGVTGKVEEIHPGPTVTTYEVAPQAGTKVSKVAGLSDDLALGLSRKVRIIAPIPGKSRIGFELPNDERVPVNLRELIEDKRFAKLAEKAPLPVVLGRDIVGAPFYADLASMPHVIVAGATGAGKSVGLNVMLTSILYHRSPEELRMLMIDPKVVELAPFDGIPHLLLPVVTDMKQAATALKWAVDEMERRYQLFANAGTKNIGTYNRYVDRVRNGEIQLPKAETVTAVDASGEEIQIPAAKEGDDGLQLPDRLPFIVIVIDEFADLMMQQGKDVEASVARLAQKARAAGMHVVLATQRPSVDVITGMIKANFPTRIAFRVAQKVDSRTILDEMGAEVLLGKGDMLVKMNGANDTRRVQCPFISEEEVDALADHCRSQGEPVYQDEILKAAEEEGGDEDNSEPMDARYDEAVRIVAETQRCSTSWLQRKMTIGYNRAAKIVEMMEKQGIVGPPNGAKDREILISNH
ncbi:MAG: DNA translocase FtsK 4TM domain-containing protein [Polyangiaceae bacterium]|nr:DNA translocase FtsK 4TM domain-containing protein [Polyangiaceae bacterium]